ncbi:MAG: hypothetical protein HOM61_02085, partial [Candidatus Marinimicrobia bacterium]|nr:hypothetical protein [Candidatus Neomarinimicrobiota bacterium]
MAAVSTTVISTGLYHTGVILDDGTVKLWGRGWQGTLGDGESSDTKIGDHSSEEPDELTALGPSLFGVGRTVVSIACGAYFSGVVLDNGQVWMTGDGNAGKTGQGNTSDRTTFGQVSNITNATDIACGYHHTLVRTSAGKVKTWGWNHSSDYGVLGVGLPYSTVNQITSVQTDATLNSGTNTLDSSGHIDIQGSSGNYPGDGNYTARTVLQIGCGGDHNIVLLDDGKVLTWGSNTKGQLGNGNTTPLGLTSTWEPGVPVSSSVTQIAAGNSHNIALKSNGTVVIWGSNTSGQQGLAHTTQQTTPHTVTSFTASSATAVAVGA